MKITNLARVKILKKSKEVSLLNGAIPIYVKIIPEPMDYIKYPLFQIINSYSMIALKIPVSRNLVRVEGRSFFTDFYVDYDDFSSILMKFPDTPGKDNINMNYSILSLNRYQTDIGVDVIRMAPFMNLPIFNMNQVNSWIYESLCRL